MKNTTPFPPRWALGTRAALRRLDPRALVAVMACCSAAAWLLPREGVLFFLAPASLLAATACLLLPGGRKALAACGFFILLWTVSRMGLHLLEHPGAFAASVEGALLLGARLFILLGFAMATPLAVTPLVLGRVLAWYLRRLARLERAALSLPPLRGRVRPVLGEGVWRAAPALVLMMAFIPRAFRALTALRRSLGLRAPNLPLRRRVALLGLATLRVLSAQTWDMTLAIASRNLYRPEPWRGVWRRS